MKGGSVDDPDPSTKGGLLARDPHLLICVMPHQLVQGERRQCRTWQEVELIKYWPPLLLSCLVIPGAQPEFLLDSICVRGHRPGGAINTVRVTSVPQGECRVQDGDLLPGPGQGPVAG